MYTLGEGKIYFPLPILSSPDVALQTKLAKDRLTKEQQTEAYSHVITHVLMGGPRDE